MLPGNYHVTSILPHLQDSLLPMWDQVNGVQAKIQSFVESAPDGVHMICCSQGKDTVIVTKRSVLYVYSFVAQ